MMVGVAPDRPGITATLLTVARTWAARGTCDRLRVGAVVAHTGRVVSTGYNGAPAGLPHCDHRGISPVDSRIIEPCMKAVHAEANAIAFAARYGVSIEGAVMYCTHSPCYNCAFLIINAGISRVVFAEPYRDPYPLDTLRSAGVDTEQFRP